MSDILTPAQPTVGPAFRLPLFDPAGRPLGSVRYTELRDGTLGDPIATGANPKMETTLSSPLVGPPVTFRLTVRRDKLDYFSTRCQTRVGVFDAQTRRVLAQKDVPMNFNVVGQVTNYTCDGAVTMVMPESFRATQPVYVVIYDNKNGLKELGRSAPMRLSDLIRQGTNNPFVSDDRTVGERVTDAAGGVGRWTEETFNKALWAGGIAGGVILLMLSRK